MEPSVSPSPQALIQQAINAALNCLWGEARKLNRQILRADPTNVDALSRLARACFELGKIELAKKYYSHALKFDPYNPIATKNLKILKSFKNLDSKPSNHQNPITPNMFLHEPGKTKVVTILKVAEPQKLSNLTPGMSVSLVVKSRNISITDQSSQYLGVLPDDIAYQLMKLIRGGNKYQAIIKSVKVNGLSIFIRENFRSSRFKNRSSFTEFGVDFKGSARGSLGDPDSPKIEEVEE